MKIRVNPCKSVVKDKSYLLNLRDLRDKKIIRANPCQSVVKKSVLRFCKAFDIRERFGQNELQR